MDDGAKAIYEKRRDLETLDRKMRTEALQAITKQNRPLFNALYEECEHSTGHKFKFDHYNFNMTYSYYKCEHCGFSEGRDR